MALRSLKGEKEFRRVRRLGTGLRHPLFSLKVTDYRPRHGHPWRPAAHIGIVVPKKVLPHAVDRNRVRRRVREALRTLPQSSHGQPLPACRGILFPTEAALHAPFGELQQALAAAMAQVPARVKVRRQGKKSATGHASGSPAGGSK
ncbi:ribonuclease P protein component [Deinococcus piscis]|uniref:Ribonuclease P protein component n=1 Tax=Deinococcus piscis TaxID=394230 RepID=A0ABQ3K4P0_9DEIO|nr:ribonuclease P protein component [Deinococcus piscis]